MLFKTSGFSATAKSEVLMDGFQRYEPKHHFFNSSLCDCVNGHLQNVNIVEQKGNYEIEWFNRVISMANKSE